MEAGPLQASGRKVWTSMDTWASGPVATLHDLQADEGSEEREESSWRGICSVLEDVGRSGGLDGHTEVNDEAS